MFKTQVMRTLIFFVLIILLSGSSSGQQTNEKEVKKTLPQQQPNKKQMQGQLGEAINEINKQIADLEKQIEVAKKEDPGSVKDLQATVDLLKKQVAMMGGLTKTVEGISEKTFEDAGKEEAIVSKKDPARVSQIPEKKLTKAELVIFIKKVHAQVETIIPAAEKTASLEIYNQVFKEYNSVAEVANAASGCWMIGHWEKALYLMGRACMEDIDDTDHLNNYAAFLISTGAEQAAIPILEYLNGLYPENSTILNNLGQAWFGLGDIDKSKKILEEAIALYPGHSMANATLCNIAQSEGQNDKAIAFLKSSLKENYDPEKEATLRSLGYSIVFDDMPEFNYPVKTDPVGISSLVELFPVKFPAHIDDDATVNDVNSFSEGAKKLYDDLGEENRMLQEKLQERSLEISGNKTYREEFLEMHNSPVWLHCNRLQSLYLQEFQGLEDLAISSMRPVLIFLPLEVLFANRRKFVNPKQIVNTCEKIWQKEVMEAIARLPYELPRLPENASCSQVDDWTNNYNNKKAALQQKGMEKIRNIYVQNKSKFDNWVMMNMLAVQDDRDGPPGQAQTDVLISDFQKTIARRALENQLYQDFLNFGNYLVGRHEYIKSACTSSPLRPYPNPGPPADLPPPRKDLPCGYIRTLKTPLVWYSAECNRLFKEMKSNLEERKLPIKKGQSHSAKRSSSNQNRGPMGNPGRGPFTHGYDTEFSAGYYLNPPLTPEVKDPSQCAVEFNKWGNLVGLNFQLNDDGLPFAVSDLPKDDSDRRWSWNAIASASTGVLYKLAIK